MKCYLKVKNEFEFDGLPKAQFAYNHIENVMCHELVHVLQKYLFFLSFFTFIKYTNYIYIYILLKITEIPSPCATCLTKTCESALHTY